MTKRHKLLLCYWILLAIFIFFIILALMHDEFFG